MVSVEALMEFNFQLDARVLTQHLLWKVPN
jgi:hypothetical protein